MRMATISNGGTLNTYIPIPEVNTLEKTKYDDGKMQLAKGLTTREMKTSINLRFLLGL